jgi:hypothetical protein
MAEHAESENGHENDPLITQRKPNDETQHTYSSFRDVSGAPDLTASVASLHIRDDEQYMRITKGRAVAITVSLGVLVLIQGRTSFIKASSASSVC